MMKKYISSLLLVLVLILAGMQSICVQAQLTEEEQIYYKTKKEERQTETETETEDESEEASEAEISETETETETEDAKESEMTTEEEPEQESASAMEVEGEDDDAPLVAIDPGHQAPGGDMTVTEPNGPGSEKMSSRLTPGTTGVDSGMEEYLLNLDVCLKLKEELLKRGYRVLMTRETHNVDIGNIERCEMANEAEADVLIHVHANSNDDSSLAGALALVPTATNPYISNIYNSCMKLADDLLDAYCETTGLNNRGIWLTDAQTVINWSKMPVMILEMGYMTNSDDDAFMIEEENQELMAQGIANGLDVYFGR